MKSGIPPDLLLEAYASGIFPMGMPDGEIRWYSPDPRGIIPLEEFHTPHGLKRTLKNRHWEIRIDTAFPEVMRACASREETWITETIAESYTLLFESGHAHSVEVWQEGKLAGGLYGVSIGGAFFGESMFHRVTDASKVALWHLVEILKGGGFILLDSQWTTPHLEQFGAREIPRIDYLKKLAAALLLTPTFPKDYFERGMR
jgi:leucyl/phenylalanyl-tRNA--protein transferase